jgi:hypothetical protein
MKLSGFEWIEDIPSDWGVKKLGFIFSKGITND